MRDKLVFAIGCNVVTLLGIIFAITVLEEEPSIGIIVAMICMSPIILVALMSIFYWIVSAIDAACSALLDFYVKMFG